MGTGGDDDTVASSLPTLDGSSTLGTDGELVGGRYRIVRWLGGGGMGRVYEALDTELEERIALKVLKSGLSDDALERFRREVKLTRRIQHRNVARMFDIGEHKGEKFLTMELVEGEPLTRRMSDRPMAWPQLESIARQLCAGLAAAHAAGVVHRDLKPDNVLIEQGTERAVLTDFGIARSGDDPSVTQVGAVVGTPRYMAPEQLAGREVDLRADLFSLGVMLFELATATRPWPGDNVISIAVSQATQPPRTIDTQSSAVPAFFAATVATCLQLEPGDRPASAADILAAFELKRPPIVPSQSGTKPGKPGEPAPPRPSTAAPRMAATPTIVEPTAIAVLPIMCAPGDEYLADGLVEDLTDTLSTTPGIRVRPAGLARQVPAPDPREVGQRLQVDHVVASSLRRTPSGLRVATRLISVADGFQIWAHKNDCSEAEVLTVADELARGIATALSTRATSDTKPTDPRAVDLYLRARAELRRFWGSHAAQAATLLEQAVEYAPTSAPILAASAYAHVQQWVMQGEPALLAPAQAALERGLATGHGEAYLASAQYQFNRGDFERGAMDLSRALVRAPMSAQSHELAAKILVEVEGTGPARKYYETARGLDPGRAHVIDSDLARLDALDRQWEAADERVNRLAADPDPSINQLSLILKGRLSVWRGDPNVIRQNGRQFLSRMSTNAGVIHRFVTEVETAGDITDSMWTAMMGVAVDPQRPLRQYLVRLQIFTELALSLDQRDKAFEALSRAADLGLMDITWMDHCPLMEKIVEYPHFQPLRRRVAERATRVLAAFRNPSGASSTS
jgi:eukaryotic-like serine/threonine-protein kinase